MVQLSIGIDFASCRRRAIGEDNSGLSRGAIKCTDEEVARLLQETQVRYIASYLITGCCLNGGKFALRDYETEESDLTNDLFNGQLHPIVEDYDWYRGFAVNVEGGKVFIFVGWMQPWYEGGAPDPIVYLLGRVSKETVRQVIQTYCSGISEMLRNAHAH